VSLVRALHEAGIDAGVVVLVGAGGQHFAAGHVQATTAALGRMGLRRGDLVYLSEIVAHPSREYARRAAAADVGPLTPDECAAQADAIRGALPRDGAGPRFARYDVREFVY
jgi:hypothetical protein